MSEQKRSPKVSPSNSIASLTSAKKRANFLKQGHNRKGQKALLRKKGEKAEDENSSKSSEREIPINYTYDPNDYPKYDIKTASPDEDVLDFLRRGVDFEARDNYREEMKIKNQ